MDESINSSHFLYNKYDDISSLELTARNHPSSAIARFLLLKQYQKTESPHFAEYASQTALYFNDPQWLAFQLFRNDTDQILAQPEEKALELEREDIVFPRDLDINEEVISENILGNTPKAEIEEDRNETIETEVNEIVETGDFIQTAGESLKKDALQDNENPLPTPEIHSSVNNNADSTPGIESEVEKPLVEKEDKEELIFEPLHTTDYFASQGVTIKEKDLVNDKLGKQMRSFSEWLKSMKQLHPNKLPEQNEVIERIIQSSAEQSNIESEVLTEAMAEVLLKQNKRQKAIEMYEKLSLMNPSKSIYFAAKIDKIKNN